MVPTGATLKSHCVDCGFLSLRVKRQPGRLTREHTGYFEVEDAFRAAPLADFVFVPGESNANHSGEFGCFRGKAQLPTESSELVAHGRKPDDAIRDVLGRERACTGWIRYEPGLSPPQQMAELKAIALEQDRQEFHRTMSSLQQQMDDRERRQDRRLVCAATILAVIIGIAQIAAGVLAMTKESFGNVWLQQLMTSAWWQQLTTGVAHVGH